MGRRISSLDSASSANDADVLPIVQGGVTKKITVDALFVSAPGTGMLPDWFNVKDPLYGAVGDGVADDTAAINLAIAAANANLGGIVYLPVGTYKVTSQLTTLSPSVWLVGATRSRPQFDTGTKIKSYVYDTLLYLSELSDTNSSRHSGVRGIHFQCQVNQAATTGWLATSAAVQINVVAASRTFTRVSGSFVTDGFQVGQRIIMTGFANAGNNRGRVIESVTALVITVTDGTSLVNETGSGDEVVASTFAVAAGACIEARGGAFHEIRDCTIEGFPIGIVFDGAESSLIENCNLANTGGPGYAAYATDGIGIWFAAGDRGRGFTISDATNRNEIRGGTNGGNKREMYIAGINNSIVATYFLMSAGSNRRAIELYSATQIRIEDVAFEGYLGTNSNACVYVSNSCFSIDLKNNFMGGEQQPIEIASAPASINHLTTISNRFGNPPAGTALKGALRVVRWTSLNDWNAEGGTLADAGAAGASLVLSRANVDPKGLRVNGMEPAAHVFSGGILNVGDPLLVIDNNATLKFIEHLAPSYQQQNLQYRMRSVATGSETSGRDVHMIHTVINAGAAAADLFSVAIPDDFFGTAEWTVIQRGNTASDYYRWVRSRDFYRAGGAITFVAAAADDRAAVFNGLTITAPDIVDAGSNNLSLRINSDAAKATTVIAVLRLVRVSD